MKKMRMMWIALALVLSMMCVTACGQNDNNEQTTAARKETQQDVVQLADGGVLVLKVNPEIAVEYDENGIVTAVTARNNDAMAIVSSCTGLIGKPAAEAVEVLITAIGQAGYFVEEIEGRQRQITVEIEAGSILPTQDFLDQVIETIRICVTNNSWTAPLIVDGEIDFGVTDYRDTDYAPGNIATPGGQVSETTAPADNKVNETTAPAPRPDTDCGMTDYDDTDYGPNNDGVTDYGKTDYDGRTDYDDGKTDYDDGKTDYDDSDYH